MEALGAVWASGFVSAGGGAWAGAEPAAASMKVNEKASLFMGFVLLRRAIGNDRVSFRLPPSPK
jgi:hypothetical protein